MDRGRKLQRLISVVDDSGKKKEAETITSDTEALLNEIRTLFQWHPRNNRLSDFADQHRMTLYHERKTDETTCCSACNSPIDGAMYCCHDCKNFLHKACAEFPEKINHPCHRSEDSHPLLRVHGPDLNINKCSGCELPIRDTTAYCCQNCDLCLHKFCLELPEKIEHPRHPSHCLSLKYDSIGSSSGDFFCKVCLKEHTGLSYSCERCDVNLGLRCIVREATRPEGNQGHILSVLGKQPWDCVEDECLACGEGFGSEVVFRCLQCEFSLHAHCALQTTMSVLPSNDSIENHRHPLNLTCGAEEFELSVAYCDVCKEHISPKHKLYHCSECNFDAHLRCALPDEAEKISNSDSELPSSVTVSFHLHPLILTESSYSVYGSAFCFFCDVCGMEGDPTAPFYACDDDDCYFVVHLSCMLSELKLSFAHKLDYAVLDTTPMVIKNPSATVSEIIESIPDEDKKKLTDAIKAATAEKVRGSTINNPQNEDHDHQNNTGSASDNELLDQIIKRFGSKCQDPRSAMRYYEPMSQVTFIEEKYKTSTNLAPVLRLLVSRYGDFSQKSTLTQTGKTFVFMVLCAALYSICTTKEGGMTEVQLFTSWDCFKIAQNADFDIDFAFKRLRKAMNDFFGLGDSNASTDQALAGLDQEMDALAPEMETLHEKCAKRMTSLLSNSIGADDTIEIVGKAKVTDSWHMYWDSIFSDFPEQNDELNTRGENSISESVPLAPTEELRGGTQDIGSFLEALFKGEADGPKSLVNLIESFIKKHPLKRSLSYFANKQYSFKEKSDKIICYKCRQIAEDPIHGCIACNNRSELPPRIRCDFHDHPLGLCRRVKDKSTTNKKKNESLCSACRLPISYPNYRCDECNIFWHKFCVEFPEKIDHHPLHPEHALSLEANSKNLQKLSCNACGEKFRGWGFSCEECKFYLEIQCLFSGPTVQSETHGKLFLLSEERKTHNVHGCVTCRKKISGPSFLRCASCNVSFHIQCAELPSI